MKSKGGRLFYPSDNQSQPTAGMATWGGLYNTLIAAMGGGSGNLPPATLNLT